MCRMSQFSLFLVLVLGSPALAEQWSGKVVKIADGDTITVLKDGHDQVKVRLYGVDAPEKAQPFGARAKQFTGDHVAGKMVVVKVHDRDRYGRTVAEIMMPDGKSLNRELVRAGMAWHYVQYAKSDRELAALEQEARQARRGLWSEPNPMPPWEWRKHAKEKRTSTR